MAPKIPKKPLLIIVGLLGATSAYFIVGKPYLERRKMQNFESEAKLIYEKRLQKENQRTHVTITAQEAGVKLTISLL
ncbi:hypothetical protein BsWGS_02108 [Bradybaena similaris]